MMELKVLIGLIKRRDFFSLNNIDDSILINNNRMIFEYRILWPNGTNPFGRNNRADRLDTRICHELLFEGMFKDDRFITLRASRYNMNRHFA